MTSFGSGSDDIGRSASQASSGSQASNTSSATSGSISSVSSSGAWDDPPTAPTVGDTAQRASKGAIAVFTSGGDAPGMNAVVRSVVRLGMHYKRDVYAVYEGYQGLVDGGDKIQRMGWKDVQMIIHKGGTVIGSARCMDFMQRAGRLRACKHLVERNISHIICCGGDGSLTGANLFKIEWPELVQELLANGDVSEEAAARCADLYLVGCVGSIDNDMVYDGTLTIGTDTALHRIVDAIDAVQSTASSHQRTFVLEIMGRHCGYLAWAAGIATGADYVFIPEAPYKHADWESALCEKLDAQRKRGARLCTVLVAEGAIDRDGAPIKTDYVRRVIVERLGHDTRATILGHVQRGGQPSQYDRVLGTVCGSMAVEKLLRLKAGEPSTIVGVRGFNPTFNPLVETVAATQLVAKLTADKDFEGAIRARRKHFKRHWEFLKSINREQAKVQQLDVDIAAVGAPKALGVAVALPPGPPPVKADTAAAAAVAAAAAAAAAEAAAAAAAAGGAPHHRPSPGPPPPLLRAPAPRTRNLCIICSGAPAGGMNAAIRAACHYGLNFGYTMWAAQGGFTGFCAGRVERLGWMEVSSWAGEAGCNIRTDRLTPTDVDCMNRVVEQYDIRGLCVIGGFDGFHGVFRMREKLKVPVAYVPATISNNVPGTDFSVGTDTAINAVVQAIDTCKKSADASASRVFIIETQGRNCGFLAMLACVASGADIVYTAEEGVTLMQMVGDIARVKEMIKAGLKRHFVVVRNEFCSAAYDVDFMHKLFAEEGTGHFSVRTVKLGHLCQGDYPSPLDRIRAALFASYAVQFLMDKVEGVSTLEMAPVCECASNSNSSGSASNGNGNGSNGDDGDGDYCDYCDCDKVVIGLERSQPVIQRFSDVEAKVKVDWTLRVPLRNEYNWFLVLHKLLSGYKEHVRKKERLRYNAVVDAFAINKDV